MMNKIVENAKMHRHLLHSNPELAFNEMETMEYVSDMLSSYGLDTRLIGDEKFTAIVGILRSKCNSDKGYIAIRVDMDALPIREQTDVTYSSKNSGKMHACGHDGHMAMVLGAAEYLSKSDTFNGTAFFLFTPAEEDGGGCEYVVNNSDFQELGIREVYAIHNWPQLDIGQIGVSDSTVMSGDDVIHVTIVGKGGHAAIPDLSINPIKYINEIIKYTDVVMGFGNCVLTPTKVSAGDAVNVIPDSVTISYSFRYLTKEVREKVLEYLSDINNRSFITENEITVEIKVDKGYPPTINDKVCADHCKAVVNSMDNVDLVENEHSMCAEDFSYLLEKIPGCYVWLGTRDEDHTESLHSCRFDFNDRVLETGIRYFVDLIMERSGRPKFGEAIMPTDPVPTLALILEHNDSVTERVAGDIIRQIPNMNYVTHRYRSESSGDVDEAYRRSILSVCENIKGNNDPTGITFISTQMDVDNQFINTCVTTLEALQRPFCLMSSQGSLYLAALAQNYIMNRDATTRKIVLLTPYKETVHNHYVKHFTKMNIEVVMDYGMGIENKNIEKISKESVRRVIDDMMSDVEKRHLSVNVFVIVSERLNILEKNFITDLEDTYGGFSFVTSTQAALWHAIYKSLPAERRSDIRSIKGYGRLFLSKPVHPSKTENGLIYHTERYSWDDQ